MFVFLRSILYLVPIQYRAIFAGIRAGLNKNKENFPLRSYTGVVSVRRSINESYTLVTFYGTAGLE